MPENKSDAQWHIVTYDPNNFGDDEPTGEVELTWWQRRKLAREIKADAKWKRKWERNQARLDAKVIKSARKELKQSTKLRRKWDKAGKANPTLAAAFAALVKTTTHHEAQTRVNAANAIRSAFTAKLDRRFKYVALVGTWLVACAIAALLVTCGCGVQTGVYRPQQAAQVDTAVSIATWCIDDSNYPMVGIEFGHGSGTLIDSTHVLTARHVVTCDGLVSERVTMRNGKSIVATIERDFGPDVDLAIVKLSEPVLGVKPARFGKRPDVGDSVCFPASWPETKYACAKVSGYGDRPNDMHIDYNVIGGNSGSPVYNGQGAIVAVITARVECRDPQHFGKFLPESSCGGRAASTQGEVLR